ncbi:MAG: hypothetical protein HY313_11050 [Acidobacteria bacterium]|nr:hypothetical protein [Acidobacteriota bacterium]
MPYLKLPSYEGLYGRAFLPPVVIVSVGRWGSKAASSFFHYLANTFSGRDISSCFARIAVVRSGITGYELNWAADVVEWPEVSGRKLPLQFDTDIQEFWAPPRSSFESVVDQLYSDLGRVVTHRYAWLDAQDGWRQQTQEIGLRVPAVAQNPQHWIVILASIYEPDVGSVLVRFVKELQQRPPIENTDCRYLFLIDAGLPDEPEDPATPWIDLPGWLAAEALIGMEQFRPRYPAIAYLLSGRNRAGRTEPEGSRIAMTSGLLRAFFCSELLDSRAAPDGLPQSNYWNEVAIPQLPGGVGMERVAHFIEFALDADNLPVVAAREAMSRWRSRIGNSGRELRFDAMKQDVLNALSGSESVEQISCRWLEAWTTDGVLQSALGQFGTLLSWMADEQNLDDAEYERLMALANAQPLLPDAVGDRWWKRLRRLLRKQPQPLQDYAEDAKLVKKRMLNREGLCRWLRFGADFFDTVYREDGPFQDTRYDMHYSCEQWDQRTIVLKLQRLPLEADCPPAIQKIVSEASNELPRLMVQCARQCSSSEAFIDQLQAALSRRFKELFNAANATVRWNTYGFGQWLASDPQLAPRLADLLCERFIVPWNPIAGHEWQGHLAVLSFERPANHDAYDPLRIAWRALAGELRRRDSASQPLIGSAQPVVADLNPDADILWIRWPQILSLGFLWFESSPPGQRFAEAVDHGPPRSRAREWLAAHPEDAPLLEFLLPYSDNGMESTSEGSE